jgi:hypothetical protein
MDFKCSRYIWDCPRYFNKFAFVRECEWNHSKIKFCSFSIGIFGKLVYRLSLNFGYKRGSFFKQSLVRNFGKFTVKTLGRSDEVTKSWNIEDFQHFGFHHTIVRIYVTDNAASPKGCDSCMKMASCMGICVQRMSSCMTHTNQWSLNFHCQKGLKGRWPVSWAELEEAIVCQFGIGHLGIWKTAAKRYLRVRSQATDSTPRKVRDQPLLSMKPRAERNMTFHKDMKRLNCFRSLNSFLIAVLVFLRIF